MGQTRRQPRPLTGLVWAAVLITLLLAGAVQHAWALPGRAPLGQTIPPPPTATRTSAAPPQPTATWTPRPTWTRVATEPPELPAPSSTRGAVATLQETRSAVATPQETRSAVATVTPAVSLPTATRPAFTHTPAVLVPTPDLSGTPSPALPPAATSPATPLPVGPIPLAFEVVVVPQVAGPQDVVQFILQVANVGYGPVDSVQVDVVFDDDLVMQSVECPRCVVDCSQCQGKAGPARLSLFIGLLPAGEQVIAPVRVQVADDAWPGQSPRTDWTLTATGLPAQTVPAAVVLPWAQLPATGGWR